MTRKLLTIFTVLICLSFSMQAQKKNYVYEDTAALNEQDPPENTPEVIVEPSEKTVTGTKVEEEETDTTLDYHVIKVSADTIRAWKEQRGFAYARYLDSLLREAQLKQERQVNGASGGKNSKGKDNSSDRKTITINPIIEPSEGGGWFDSLLQSTLTRVILWTLAAGFVIFILLKLFLQEGIFRKKTKSVNQEGTSEEPAPDDITHPGDYASLARQAAAAGNYRLAVRYLYLQALHRLAGKNVVTLAVDKTNYQYVQETYGTAYQDDFAAITLHYEYVWYGEFAIEADLYKRIENAFTNFNQKL